ncbi:MAG: putative membrane protein [Patiriisocius sp.]|jgi:uncharacterized membrane protein
METTSNPGKTIAIISYITLIGWIIAFIMNNTKKNVLASFHLRQSLGIQLVYFAISVLISITGIGMLQVLYLGALALVILGIINANNEEEKPLPIVGEYFENWFHTIG